VIEHHVVKPAKRFLKLAIAGMRITELGPDMAKVDPADVRDVLAAGCSPALSASTNRRTCGSAIGSIPRRR
jgi:hypothetical protein